MRRNTGHRWATRLAVFTVSSIMVAAMAAPAAADSICVKVNGQYLICVVTPP